MSLRLSILRFSVLDGGGGALFAGAAPPTRGLLMSTGRRPAVFIHGLWLHATSWGPWLELFEEAGYDPVAPGWPNEPDTVAAAREHPEAVANIGIDEVTEHMAAIVDAYDEPPVLIGHS